MADVAAQRATCNRLSVGAVITDAEGTTVLSIGYNGAARGMQNGCLRPEEPGNCGCVMHAEINAALKAPYDRGDLVLYCTHAPCERCAMALLNTRVRRVVFRNFYRDTAGLVLLLLGGVAVAHYVSDYEDAAPWEPLVPATVVSTP